MEKDFDSWNKDKKNINNCRTNKFYHERQIWWCSFGLNVGHEQDGSGSELLRPALIIKGMSRETCLIVPLTSSTEVHAMRIPIGLVLDVEASAILSQMRVFDTKRFVEKVGYIKQDIFVQLRKAAKDML
jgi:mRNA interferase MazF